jgi:sugar lactone lactonase YvrE
MKRIVFYLTATFLLVALVLIPFSSPVIARQNGETRLYSQSANPTATAIQGAVKDANGDPVIGVTVGAGDYTSLLSCGAAAYWTTTDASGNYTLNVSQGNYLVFVNSHHRPEGYLPEAYPGVYSWAKISSAAAVHVNTGQWVSSINFNLPFGYKLTGRLVDGASQPVLGAGGHLEDPVQKIEYACALGGGSSSVDGAFEFNVPAGLYDLGFCKNSQCHTIFKGKIIRAATSLGDVVFKEAGWPSSTFNPQAVMPGYNIMPVVPGGPNCASDVTVTPNGKVYLAAVRSWNIYEVSPAGGLSVLAGKGVYSLQAGSDGNLYGYFSPSFPGVIYKITSGGSVSTVGTLPQTSCESTLAVDPNLDVWIGFNGCGGTSMTNHTLYRMTQAGDVMTMTTVSGYIDALDFDSSGNLYMTSDSQLYQVNKSSGTQTALAKIPEPTSHHGLAAGQGGNKYIATSWNDGKHPVDRIYKVTPSKVVSILAEMPAGCLEGLDQAPNGDLLGTMRCTGALYRIHLNGIWDKVLPGNGMSTPDVIAFNPAGELLVNNDESATITKIQNGNNQFFASVDSFIPPYAAFAFLPSGYFYFSEAAPGLTPYLSLISPAGKVTHVVTGTLGFPAGLAFNPSGQLFVAEYMTGTISQVSSTGTRTQFASGLTRPEPLAADSSGNLYVGDFSGTLTDPKDPAEFPITDRIWKVDASGAMTKYLDHELRMIAISPGNTLYISGQVGNYYYGVLRVNADKSLTPIAIGFLDPVGLAFDVAGDLYVADVTNNSIYRITGFMHAYLAGHIKNTVSGAAISKAVIHLITGYPLVKGAYVTANGDGYYTIQAEARQYFMTVSAPGFCPITRPVTLSAGETTTVNLALQPCPTVFLPLVRAP